MITGKEIIDWYEYTTLEKDVGINNEQYDTVTNYEPIFEGESIDDAKRRVGEVKE